ncbi:MULTISPECIES: hypothetical protein [unclassified Clostridium]|uniref:hypothetical protein n=1 Tax=unclassified Clostridium TaxID=2614128 RepID=UPI0025BC585A|nr:hypothetical protein [Clostridium sp.]MDY2629753.1 hypothetical protein [Clostridium sp.]MDY4251014.1 hypothetical protein [Clostridium sp.]
MSKDILDKLEIKNYENLLENEFKNNTVLEMNKDLDKLKINDDFSNEDALNNEYISKVTNSYIELRDVIKDDDRHKINKDDKNKTDLNSLILNKI